MSKQSFRDLKETIELKDGEIEELTMELETKKDEINKLKLYSTKLKYEKQNLEDKLDNEINNEKAKMKELDDLDKKIKEKQEIIDDKQDQVKYLRSLIDDYKTQIKDNTENLEIQLRKISKTFKVTPYMLFIGEDYKDDDPKIIAESLNMNIGEFKNIDVEDYINIFC